MAHPSGTRPDRATNSGDIDSGIETAICNQRGITTRSPTDGGDQERRLAETYREKIQRFNGWPRTSAIFKSLANRCSQCAGKVSTTAKTRKPRTTNSDGPHLPIEDEVCCVAFASVTVDLLDSFQRIPYGTLAWKQSYGRRNIIEKANSMLKDKGGLNAGWCRALGLAAQTIGALALAIVHNLKRTETLPRTPKAQRHRPRTRFERNRPCLSC